jgi:hypothetical protein
VYQPGGPESRRGLIPFLSLLFAPDTSINTMPFFVNGGLVYRGPFASRPRDRAAFGVVYGSFSNELARSQRAARRAGSAVGIQSYELVLELTYRFQLTGWLRMQPNVQYIINPGATGSIPDALSWGSSSARTSRRGSMRTKSQPGSEAEGGAPGVPRADRQGDSILTGAAGATTLALVIFQPCRPTPVISPVSPRTNA